MTSQSGCNGINALRPSCDVMRQIKISGRHGNGKKMIEKVMSFTTRLVSIVKTYQVYNNA